MILSVTRQSSLSDKYNPMDNDDTNCVACLRGVLSSCVTPNGFYSSSDLTFLYVAFLISLFLLFREKASTARPIIPKVAVDGPSRTLGEVKGRTRDVFEETKFPISPIADFLSGMYLLLRYAPVV